MSAFYVETFRFRSYIVNIQSHLIRERIGRAIPFSEVPTFHRCIFEPLNMMYLMCSEFNIKSQA